MLPSFIVRNANADDLPILMRFFKSLSPSERIMLIIQKEFLYRECKEGKNIFLLIFESGKIGAYVRKSDYKFNYILVEEFLVVPKWRKKGIGKYLLAWLKELYPRIIIETNWNYEPINKMLLNHLFIVTSQGNKKRYWINVSP